MEIILKEKVENLGTLGEVVSVRAGYARNYLIPYGKAVQATAINLKEFEAQKADLERLENERIAKAQANAEVISSKQFEIKAQAGDGGKLFGSIGTKEVADVVKEVSAIEIERRHVRMPEGAIRQIGEYEVALHLHTGVDITVTIVVSAQ
ncbi:50S ribosomal protein L9 [Thiotrichales bacterium 19S11-10]|nr:50S ribosomal protein L9 [Thiotrichales bacterium 19S11-10]MCF6807885.1 50S ribosomal protein L9 [Thiotrichales bacterium 19S9-11]MCF6811899.1 50S ribosomal protein L9 [Thiotrichales bacterium 19S9-12]